MAPRRYALHDYFEAIYVKHSSAAASLIILVFSSITLGADERPPNVVLIVSDDQAWTDFGFMGHEVIQTPHLDRLAAESTTFRHGYVPTSLCRASLATLLTGLYPHQHRICCNDPPDGEPRSSMLSFIEEAPTIPRLLSKVGYTSLQTGKFWEEHYAKGGFTQGMTDKGRHGEAGLTIGRETMQPMVDFIEENRENPFFLWYAPMMPHTPHNPPVRYLKKYASPDRPIRLARYYAMCAWFDETCGKLLDEIDRQGLRDNTLVIFVVDNGWIQQTGDKRTTRGWFAPKSKLSPYDGGLRTPIMLRWPGHTKPAILDDLVSSVDIAPTILEACGAEVPPVLPGLSLLDVAAAEQLLPRESVYGELYTHTAVDVNRPAANLTHRWIRNRDWKLVVPEDPAASVELYDISIDPLEQHDVAASHPNRVAMLREELDAWWTP